MQHFLSYPTNSTYACGADAVGRRNTRTDTNPLLTDCAKCLTSAVWFDAPATDADRCAGFRVMDERFDTPGASPLHHDNRCPIHSLTTI